MENPAQLLLERLRIVSVSDQAANLKKLARNPAPGRKDKSSALKVHVADGGRRHAGAKRERNDPACRGASDHVEVAGYRPTAEKAPLDLGEEGGRQNAANAAAVDRQDAKG